MMASKNSVGFNEFLDNIALIKGVAKTMGISEVKNYSSKIVDYDPEHFHLDVLGKFLYYFVGLRLTSSVPLLTPIHINKRGTSWKPEFSSMVLTNCSEKRDTNNPISYYNLEPPL